MRFVISGAGGFLGRHLTRSLLNKGHVVFAILGKGETPFLPADTPNLFYLELDLLHSIEIEPLEKIDAFYNFAWAGVDTFYKNDDSLQKTNLKITDNFYQFCKKSKCPKFIVPGSASEFGGTSKVISGLGSSSPVDRYSETKIIIRERIAKSCEKDEITLCWPLITSIYGPGREGSNVLYSAITSFSTGKPFHCTKLQQEWDFLYIDDAIVGLYLLGVKPVRGGIYPLGSGIHHQLSWYVEKIHKKINPSIGIIMDVPYKNNRIDNQVLDISKIQEETGFSPSISFLKGLNQWLRFLAKDN